LNRRFKTTPLGATLPPCPPSHYPLAPRHTTPLPPVTLPPWSDPSPAFRAGVRGVECTGLDWTGKSLQASPSGRVGSGRLTPPGLPPELEIREARELTPSCSRLSGRARGRSGAGRPPGRARRGAPPRASIGDRRVARGGRRQLPLVFSPLTVAREARHALSKADLRVFRALKRATRVKHERRKRCCGAGSRVPRDASRSRHTKSSPRKRAALGDPAPVDPRPGSQAGGIPWRAPTPACCPD
jgi:hypothetical protein